MKQLPEDILPPKWADKFLEWYCYKPLYDSISGDMLERFDEYLELHGEKKARRKYWFDVLRFMNRHTLKRSNSKVNNYNPFTMFSNYFKVGFRNLLKNKSFTAINVLGLSVSMAVCLVIILMINDQMSYDDFQENGDRIYRVTHDRTNSNIGIPMATAPLVLSTHLEEEFAGIEHMVLFRRSFGGEVVQDGKAISLNGLYTGPSFFDMFSFELLYGNKATCLEAPNSIVLRKDVAEKFFGFDNPVGETLTIKDGESYLVTGVLEEFPGKTHIQFESLMAIEGMTFTDWESSTQGYIYFTLNEGVDVESMRPLLAKLADENYDDQSEYLIQFDIQKMTNITPGPLYGNQLGPSMPSFFVIGLMVLAALIIICAAFNYTNLSAARALSRTKEVGVRKVMGARRGQLTMQFMVESVLLSLLSLVVAIGLLQILVPAFENLQMSSLLDWNLHIDGQAYLQFLGFSVLVGLVTGLFPSLYLSSFKPISAMKKVINTNKLSRVSLRKALIVSQFVISLVLIISTTLVNRQIKYMVEKDYGYTKENIINIELQGQDFDILKTELERLSFVEKVAGASIIPNTGVSSDIDVRLNSADEPQEFNLFSVNEEYVNTLNLTLQAGENLIKADDGATGRIMINETAVKALGFESNLDAIGQSVILSDSTISSIAGVIKDYTYMILYMDIQPLVYRYNTSAFGYAQVKVAGFDIDDELVAMESVWDEFDPNHDFEYKTFQGQIDEFNAFFYDIMYIIGLVSVLSITIAALGLLGIASYSIKVRMKEVSIRKVLGASVRALILLLSKSFMTMFGIAMVIGFTLAYLGNNLWLDGFAYRVDFGVDIFLIATFIMVIIGVFTIGLQAFRATNDNPAANLRDD